MEKISMQENSSNENIKHTKEAIESIAEVVTYKWAIPESSAKALVEEIIMQYLKREKDGK